jgi:outer membrane biosynthesis protein TonB
MGRKIATIGITVNLENYENLRLEVQGEIGPEGSTEDLIQFLDGLLARLGHGDEATAELVENYRRRVLAMPGSAAAGEAAARREMKAPPAAARPAPAAAPAPQVPGTAEPAPAEARHEPPPLGDETPVTVRVSPDGKAAKSAPAQAPAPARAPEPRKAPAPQAPAEAAKAAPKETAKGPAQPEKPAIAEGEVACEACGASITRNQEKLSKLLTGKSLCKRCMNP